LYYFCKVACAGLITGIFAYIVWPNLLFSNEFINLGLIGITSALFYGLTCFILKVEQAHKIWGWMTRTSSTDHE